MDARKLWLCDSWSVVSFSQLMVFNMPTTTSILLSKAISLGLNENERALISPPLLAQLAVGRHISLTPSDRRRLPKTTLALLAIGGFIELTRYERDSFSPHTLVMLALHGRAELKDSELARLSADLRTFVKNTKTKQSKCSVEDLSSA